VTHQCYLDTHALPHLIYIKEVQKQYEGDSAMLMLKVNQYSYLFGNHLTTQKQVLFQFSRIFFDRSMQSISKTKGDTVQKHKFTKTVDRLV
jgi:hypothetical protein